MKISVLIVILLGVGLLNPVVAETIDTQIKKICKHQNDDTQAYECRRRSRFQPFQPNFAIIRNDYGQDDPIQFHYSFRYYLSEPDCRRAKRVSAKSYLTCLKRFHKRQELFLTYTGDFDFYLGQRASSPVINRISNPAIHFRKYLGERHNGFLWWDFAFEHRSNGQVVDANQIIDDPGSANDGRYRTQVEFENANLEYFDALSRSVNYFSLESHILINLSKHEHFCAGWGCIKLWVKIKGGYLDEESEITWGDLVGLGRNFSDYDRLRVVVSTKLPTKFSNMEFSAVWLVGDEWLTEDSINLQLYIPLDILNKRIPFFIRYHKGPMATLSDYTRHQESIGIGLNFY